MPETCHEAKEPRAIDFQHVGVGSVRLGAGAFIDPRGNEYYYGARTHSGSVARFEEDTTRGPGNEVWLHPMVTPGEYRVYYHLYTMCGSIVTVRGSVVHSVDRDELQPQTLRVERDKPLAATIVVDAEANVEVQ